MTGLVAIVDIGKTHLKLHVLSESGELLKAFELANQVVTGDPYPHFDTDSHWQWLMDALAGFDAVEEISKIVPVTHGAAAALVDETGLVLPILDYEFEGVTSTDTNYELLRDPFADSLSPNLPMGLNLGHQLHWQQKHFPEAFSRATALLLYPQYWAWRLSGVLATEVTSLGAHSDLWRPEKKDFSTLVARLGWTRLTPPIQPAWEALGSIRQDVAARTGLPADCEIFCGIHDSNASYLRYIKDQTESISVVSTGTWVICMGGSISTSQLDEQRDMLANVDVFGRPVPCARFMGGREFAAISELVGKQANSSLEDARNCVQQGTMALPSFARTGGPFLDQAGRIVYGGPDSDIDGPTLGSLYCALVTDYCLDLLDSRDRIVIEGPFIKDEVFTGTLAALRPTQELYVSSDMTGTVSGAYLLANWEVQQQRPACERVTAMELPGIFRYRDQWRNDGMEVE